MEYGEVLIIVAKYILSSDTYRKSLDPFCRYYPKNKIGVMRLVQIEYYDVDMPADNIETGLKDWKIRIKGIYDAYGEFDNL